MGVQWWTLLPQQGLLSLVCIPCLRETTQLVHSSSSSSSSSSKYPIISAPLLPFPPYLPPLPIPHILLSLLNEFPPQGLGFQWPGLSGLLSPTSLHTQPTLSLHSTSLGGEGNGLQEKKNNLEPKFLSIKSNSHPPSAQIWHRLIVSSCTKKKSHNTTPIILKI